MIYEITYEIIFGARARFIDMNNIIPRRSKSCNMENYCFRSILGFTFCREDHWACSDLEKECRRWRWQPIVGRKVNFWGDLLVVRFQKSLFCDLEHILLNVSKKNYKIQSIIINCQYLLALWQCINLGQKIAMLSWWW